MHTARTLYSGLEWEWRVEWSGLEWEWSGLGMLPPPPPPSPSARRLVGGDPHGGRTGHSVGASERSWLGYCWLPAPRGGHAPQPSSPASSTPRVQDGGAASGGCTGFGRKRYDEAILSYYVVIFGSSVLLFIN